MRLVDGESALDRRLALAPGEPLRFALADHVFEGFHHVVGQEGAQTIDIAILKRHEDHFIGPARTLQEFRDAEAGLGHLHRGQGLGGIGSVIDVVGDVTIRTALDHCEVTAGFGAPLRPLGRRVFIAIPRSQNAAQLQDQENRDPGQHKQLQ